MVLIAIALTALVFHPILRNYFFGDDLYNLYHIVNDPLGTYLLTPYGGHVLVARNFVFYLCYEIFGTAAPGYFWLVLLTHLANVALVYSCLHIFTGSRRLATFGAALWGSAPLQEGSLGWYSVYGNVMAGTVAFWLLRDLARSTLGHALSSARLLSWLPLLAIGCTSFGVGLAVALVLPVLVWLLHPRGPARTRACMCSALFAAAVLPAYFAIHNHMLTPEAAAVATSTLNLQTLTNWQPMLGMFADLAGYGIFSLGLREATPRLPYNTGIGIALIAAVVTISIAGFIRADRRARGILLAGAVLAMATYGAVIAGRGLLWGKGFYLATRYQYIPLAGVVVCVCVALAAIDTRRAVSSTWKNAALGLWVIAALAVHFAFSPGIDHHNHARRATETEIKEMWRRIRAAPAGQDVSITNQIFRGVGPLMIRNPKTFPGWAAAFTIFFPDNVVEGRRVFFVEADPEVRDANRNGKRTATLIVAP